MTVIFGDRELEDLQKEINEEDQNKSIVNGEYKNKLKQDLTIIFDGKELNNLQKEINEEDQN